MTMTIKLMTEQDLPRVAELLQANAASQNGGLLGEFPLEKVREMFTTSLSVVIAEQNGTIAGVVFSFPWNTNKLPPLVAYINQTFPDIVKNNWLYGPICIDQTFRGGTTLKSLFNGICAQNSGKAIAFINSDNARSLRAHEKLGMAAVAECTFDDTDYIIVSS